MFAGIFDVQIPIIVTDVRLGALVHQVPANIVKIAFGFRRINRQRKVTTTQTPTLFAITIILRHKHTSKSLLETYQRAQILRPQDAPVNQGTVLTCENLIVAAASTG